MPLQRCQMHGTFRESWESIETRYSDRRWLIVVDRNLLDRHASVLRGLPRTRRKSVVALRGGESVKQLRNLGVLADAALEQRLGRDGIVVAVGGGTIGDLAGLFAATWMRGVPWIPVATTTLAVADSALGGKTAVDWRGTKNLLGRFHQPLETHAVREAFDTLPVRHYRAGLAEVVKSAVIADSRLFARLEGHAPALRRRESPELVDFLLAASKIKARIVRKDPGENSIRAWLNFGHTVGHALEAIQRPRLLHGEAVASGMIAASWLSERLVAAPPGTTDRVGKLLHGLGLLRALNPIDRPAFWATVRADKKAHAGSIRLALTPRIGSATVCDLPSRTCLMQAIRQMEQRCPVRASKNLT